jgi:phenylacetate-CoA ligase
VDHYDPLEARDPHAREASLLAALARQVAHAKASAPAFADLLRDVDPGAVTSRAALAALPVTRKGDLLARQEAQRGVDPFAGFATFANGPGRPSRRPRRVFQSPGPIYEPQGAARDYWRTARALYAAGFRPGDLAHNSFSYHLTPAGAMMEGGLHALGCTVFPGGVGQTELQLQAIVDLQPDGYVGTPSFLRILVEKAEAAHLKVDALRKALVSGEAFPGALRDWLLARGIEAFQCYATAEVGLIAYETSAREGLVLAEEVLLEIVRTGTGDPVPDGEVGEVVVTTFDRDHPLIRFGTGDLSAILPGSCPTGRTNTRIRGWLGRADQTVKVRGMFVHPAQVAALAKRHAEIVKARLVVSGEMANDTMTLELEVSSSPDGLADAVAQTLREVTKLRGEVRLHAPGELPNDGKVIEDSRRLP